MWFKILWNFSQLFDAVRKQISDPLEYIKPISGDCMLPELGLSEQDAQTLQDNVDIIIHSAATVRFNEPLSTATRINVESTMDLIKLAQGMEKLKVIFPSTFH